MTMEPSKAPRHRVRRIASDEAHSWARNLRLGNPHAKYVLCMLTLYVNGEGSCFVGAGQLAEDCELAIETVRKRLAFLEQIGAVARFAQWLDEHGRRNSDGRGRRTSDDIRLLIDGDLDAIEARAMEKSGRDGDAISPPRDGELTETVSPPPGGGANDEGESVSLLVRSPLGVGLPPSCVGGLTPEPEPEPEPESSPYPLRDPLGGLRPFADRFPIPISDVETTLPLWTALSATEQAEVLLACDGYAAFLKEHPKRAPQDAHRWLSKGAWRGYVDTGRKPRAAALVRIDRGTEQWIAWEIYYGCCGSSLPGTGPLIDTCFVIAEWPPVGRGLDPNRKTWVKVYEGSGQFAAWCRRLREGPANAIGMRTEPDGGKYRGYLQVPLEWPTPKGDAKEHSEVDSRELSNL